MTWIRAEHTALHGRLHDWFVAEVPFERWTERPGDLGCSLAYLTLHTAVHQDVAVNAVLRGTTPLAVAHWDALGAADLAPASALNERDVLPPTADPAAIVAYADAVHASTATWLATATPDDLDLVPPAADRLAAAGITADDVAWVPKRWSGQPTAWFLQWEAIGHTLLHHGEMAALRVRLGVRS